MKKNRYFIPFVSILACGFVITGIALKYKTTEDISQQEPARTEADVKSELAYDAGTIIQEETPLSHEEEREKDKETDWVASLNIASEEDQLIVVSVENGEAELSFHMKADGSWKEEINCRAEIGEKGLGKSKEGDRKTPRGLYHVLFGFGIKADPGCKVDYTRVDDSYYWVDDTKSSYYNKFVTTEEIEKDWTSAEHISTSGKSYNYVLATDYNLECEAGAGSGIFIHCKPTGGAGCIAISEENMLKLVKSVEEGCPIIIDDIQNINSY